MPPSPSVTSASVPLYAKVGWVVAWLVILLMLAMISRNCATSVIYGKKTDPQRIEFFYQQGIVAGREGRSDAMPDEAKDNPVLRKAYSKGYRQGVDRRTNVIVN